MSEQEPEAVEPEVIEGQEAIPVEPEAPPAEDTEAVGDETDADASSLDHLAVPSGDEPDHDADAAEVEAPVEESGE